MDLGVAYRDSSSSVGSVFIFNSSLDSSAESIILFLAGVSLFLEDNFLTYKVLSEFIKVGGDQQG